MKLEITNKTNFNLYKAFYMVANTKSLTEAAKELNVSQPALSYSIKQLEEQLNVSLFYRKNKGVFLTTEGETLYESVSKAFEIIYIAENKITDNCKNKDNNLVIGTLSHFANAYVSDLIRKLIEIEPDLNIKIVERGSTTLKTMLENKEIDIIFDVDFENSEKRYTVKKISKQKYCFAGIKEVMENEERFFENNFILPAIGAASRKVCDDYFDFVKRKIKPKIEVFTTETMLSLVKKGLGVGFFLESTITQELNDNVLYKRDIKSQIENVYLSCAYLKENSNKYIKIINNLI